MKLGEMILQAQTSEMILKKKDTPSLFLIAIGNEHGGRAYCGYQPVNGKGLFGAYPYVIKFCLPGLSYIDLLHTEDWYLHESKKDYEFFRDLVRNHKWDVSVGIDDITDSLQGIAVVTYARGKEIV